jgi:putative nucleotidyltransferase with HDIG domain
MCNGIIWSLTNALDQKDPYTAGHSARVTQLALAIGRRMGLGSEDLMTVARGAQLHDVGKVIIDLSFINKPGKLSDREWALMKKHPSIGASILAPLCFLHREIQIVAHHHEWWDGRGYPDGLAGEELDLLTCIVSAADSFDAMTSGRCYRPETMDLDTAAHEFERCRGTQFHPDVADIVVRLIKKNEVPGLAKAMAKPSLIVVA